MLPLIRADEHSPASFAMELARHFKLDVQEPADDRAAQALITAILRERRVLLILDNAVAWQNLRYMLPTESAAVIMVTTRGRDMHTHIRLSYPQLKVEKISLEKFTPEEALSLFRTMLDSDYKTGEKETYLQIAENLGFLPIALRQIISLMLFPPYYSAKALREKLAREDRLDLLSKGIAAEENDERAVEAVFDLSTPLLTEELVEALKYLAVCAPGPIPADFLTQLSCDKNIAERLEKLFSLSYCERREEGGGRSYELHQLVRELVNRRFANPFQKEFIDLVHTLFTGEEVHFTTKDALVPQFEEAFALMTEQKDERLKNWLYDLAKFCTFRGYAAFYIRLSEAVERLFPDDLRELGTAYAHRALVLSNLGKLDEAMALHKKEEKICDELGDRAGLSRCYGNQALILKDLGKLDEAMVLHKKEEKISEELDDQAGLAACYTNQAEIYFKQGEKEKADDLYKAQEKIYVELSDRSGLAKSLWGQAIILRDRKKLDEAMALYKKVEDIFKELGDKNSLAQVWWNQGEIHGDKGDTDKKIELWQKAIATKKEIGIPTAEDEEKLAELIKRRER